MNKTKVKISFFKLFYFFMITFLTIVMAFLWSANKSLQMQIIREHNKIEQIQKNIKNLTIVVKKHDLKLKER